MSETLIAASQISKTYEGERQLQVLSDLDLEIAAGESVSIIGQSGVGKSTLLHILGTLDKPTTGEVLFDGTDLFALDPAAQAAFRNREIGYVFQFHHLLPDFNALENVMMPALINRMSAVEAEEKARKVLDRVGLSERLTHRPGQLSGGEQQRVAVARAVIMAPRAILADEPTGNLDPKTSEQVHELLLDLNSNEGIAFIIVTHNQDLSRSVDRTLRLVDGGLVQE